MKASISLDSVGILRKNVPIFSIFTHYISSGSNEKYIALNEHNGEWLCIDFSGEFHWTHAEAKVYVLGKLELQG